MSIPNQSDQNDTSTTTPLEHITHAAGAGQQQLTLSWSSLADTPAAWLRIDGGECINPRDPKRQARLPVSNFMLLDKQALRELRNTCNAWLIEPALTDLPEELPADAEAQFRSGRLKPSWWKCRHCGLVDVEPGRAVQDEAAQAREHELTCWAGGRTT